MLLCQADLSHEYWLKATERIKMLFFTPQTCLSNENNLENMENTEVLLYMCCLWIQKYRPRFKTHRKVFNVIQTSFIYLRNMLPCTCQMFNLWMKWPDCTSRDENHRAPYQSPFTIYTHRHTQLLEPLELQTESRGYLQTARTNIRFIFVLTTSSNNMLMSAFSMSRLLQCNKAKNYSTLNCVKILKKAQSQTAMHHEDREKERWLPLKTLIKNLISLDLFSYVPPQPG